MSYIIDAICVVREIVKLSFVVLTSPFAIIGGLLLLGNNNF